MGDLTRALAPGSPERVLVVFRLHGLRAPHRTLRNGRARRAARGGASAPGWPRSARPGSRTSRGTTSGASSSTARSRRPCSVLGAATAALDELGEPHDVTAEAGVALLPEEADDPISALEQADRRILPGGHTERERRLADRSGRRGENQEHDRSAWRGERRCRSRSRQRPRVKRRSRVDRVDARRRNPRGAAGRPRGRPRRRAARPAARHLPARRLRGVHAPRDALARRLDPRGDELPPGRERAVRLLLPAAHATSCAG